MNLLTQVEAIIARKTNLQFQQLQPSEFKHSLKLWYLGLYFGYPKCCISNFIRLHRAGKDKIAVYMCAIHNEDFFDQKNNPGYVRCHSCKLKPVPLSGRRMKYLTIASFYSGFSKQELINEKF